MNEKVLAWEYAHKVKVETRVKRETNNTFNTMQQSLNWVKLVGFNEVDFKNNYYLQIKLNIKQWLEFYIILYRLKTEFQSAALQALSPEVNELTQLISQLEA